MARRDSLRILLVQIRQEDAVREEELTSFCQHANLERHQVDTLDVFRTPAFAPQVVDGYDALWVGGSSSASVLEPERYPFVESAKQLLRYCIERDTPVFASCFGFQLAVLELGGRITRDRDEFEMGTIPIQVLPAAEGDPVFGRGARSLLAVSVHQESALRCPPGCVELARSDSCCHAFRVRDRRFWAFQFHPELDRERLTSRLTAYRAQYTGGEDHLDAIIASLEDVAEANALLRAFVDRVLVAC